MVDLRLCGMLETSVSLCASEPRFLDLLKCKAETLRFVMGVRDMKSRLTNTRVRDIK